MALKDCCSSQKNFAANMNSRIFTFAERALSNVRGKQGKSCLDPEQIQFIKQTSLKLYPIQSQETEKGAWNACVVAINEVKPKAQDVQ